MVRPVSRRKSVVASGDSEITKRVNKCYCRKCQTTKAKSKFLDATDTFLDQNGKMSICIDCINEIFDKFFAIENDISKALLIMCRMLNVAYLDSAVQATITNISKNVEKTGIMSNVFSVYKSKVSSISALNQTGVLTFSEPSTYVSDNPMEDDSEDTHDVKQFWGSGLSFEDYEWLETELAEWKNTHKVDTRSELSLLKMIVLKLFDIRKAREAQKDSSALEKSFQELLKTSALSPAMSNQANQGKAQETFGVWIKDIEQLTPAEWWDERRKNYIDVNNFGKYCNDYITRPISNFFGISKDFNVSEEGELSDDDIPLDELGDVDANFDPTISK